MRWTHFVSACLIALAFHASGALLAPDAAEARGVRGPRMAVRGLKPTRMKTYRFNGKNIRGYRNFVRERRAAKLASGGFKMRKDGSVIHKDMRIKTGRVSLKSPLRPMPSGPAEGTVLGQCRNGASITGANLDWACRDAGGIGWAHQPPRISGIRDY